MLHDEATGKFQPLETETTKPGYKTQWTDIGPPENKKWLADKADYENETPRPPINAPGNKPMWLDTEVYKPPRNKPQWQGIGRPEGNGNMTRWSDSGTVINKQWQNANIVKRENETWRTPNLLESENKAWSWRDTEKTKEKNELDVMTSRPKRNFHDGIKQEAKPDTESSSVEPILMKLPKVTLS